MTSLRQRDAQVLWHPATHFSDLEHSPPIPISAAKGAWLFDDQDRSILDAISSWWTTIHGHCHPHVVESVQKQIANLDHVMFAGFTHEPALTLAERLLDLAPEGYGKVFFSDCGSASVEIAMKLSYQTRVLQGETKRNRFATLDNGYHGETLGALSVCGSDQYHHFFRPLLLDVLHLPCPKIAVHQHSDLDRYDTSSASQVTAAQSIPRSINNNTAHRHPQEQITPTFPSNEGNTDQITKAALALLSKHAEELTAIVIEPLVQCAGQMAMHGSNYYRQVVEAAQQLGIHVISDEIAVGFGRTGKVFANEWAHCRPDFLCLSKGLSGGTMALACTLIRSGFERHFASDPRRSFLHSHTFTANPIACAAANANLDLILHRDFSSQLQVLVGKLHSRALEVTRQCPQVSHMRQCGTIVAFDLNKTAEEVQPVPHRLGLKLRMAALDRGVLLRPLHNTIYWMPPLIIDDDAIETLCRVTCETIHDVLPITSS